MESFRELKQEIQALAAQLEKLWKVINHSDPSAKEKKIVLHNKYKRTLATIADSAKRQFQWDDVRHLINTSVKETDFPVSLDLKKVIGQKLLQDFEEQFVAKYVPDELKAPDLGDQRQRERIRRIRRQIRTNRKTSEKRYTRDNLMEIIQLRDQQRSARKNLDKIISAVNKLNPEILEAQFKQIIDSKD